MGPVPEQADRERLATCEARYQQLAAEIASIGIIASGSLARRSHRCGKRGCGCGADPPRLHGPYWHLTAKTAGKTVNRRLSSDQAALYQQWIDNDRQLRSLTDQLRSVAREIIEFTLKATSTNAKV